MIRWMSATMRLACGCNTGISRADYDKRAPGEDVECKAHGDTTVQRISKVEAV